MNMTDDEVGRVWTDPDASRRVGVFLARLMGALIVAGLVGPVVIGLVIANRLTTEERDDDLAFGALVALTPADSIDELLRASDRLGWRIGGEGESTTLGTVDRPIDPDGEWAQQVAGLADGGRHFSSTDPSGETWWHVAVAAPGGDTLVVGRRANDVNEMARTLTIASIALGLALAALVAGVWMILHHRVARTAQKLVAAGDDLRVRGAIRDNLRNDLTSLPRSPVELRHLGRVLEEIETDSQRGFGRADALLNAAGALGGSLDSAQVLESTIEHLQRLLDIDRCAILQYDSRLEVFQVVADRGHSAAYLSEVTTRGHEPTLPSLRALRDGLPVQVPDTEAEVISPSLRARARRHGYRALLAVPLARDLETPTVLLLHTNRPHTFSFDEIELSKSFASIAGAALRNADLFRLTDSQLHSQTSRLEAIVESVDQGLLVEGADGRIVLANSAMRRLLPEPGAGIDGWSSEEFLTAVVSRADAPEATMARIAAMPPDAEAGHLAWCDVELVAPESGSIQSFRVRRFSVCDNRGDKVGSGLTWLDVSRDRELERMKSGLLATVSHEFRTPLTLIKGYASTLLADDVEWTLDDQRRFLRLVSGEADRLATLVQSILDMRRIDAGMVALQVMPVELDVVVDSVLDSVPHIRHRIRIGDLPDETVAVDAARIVTALRNLVENACKYSPPERDVEVDAVAHDGSIEITVRDHGVGVDPGMAERIFDTFVRVDPGSEIRPAGIGLGLSIARGFVEAHGGTLAFRDPADGTGAAFSVQLPIAQPTIAETVT